MVKLWRVKYYEDQVLQGDYDRESLVEHIESGESYLAGQPDDYDTDARDKVEAARDVLARLDQISAPVEPYAGDLPPFNAQAEILLVGTPVDEPTSIHDYAYDGPGRERIAVYWGGMRASGDHIPTYADYFGLLVKNGGPNKMRDYTDKTRGIVGYRRYNHIYLVRDGMYYAFREHSKLLDLFWRYLGTDQESEIIRQNSDMENTPQADTKTILNTVHDLDLRSALLAFQNNDSVEALATLRSRQRAAVALFVRYGFSETGAWRLLRRLEFNGYSLNKV